MKITQKIMASALMLAIGLSTVSAADVTNNWFEVNFTSGYADNVVLAGITKTDGAWTKTGDDASTMTNHPVNGKIARINGLGGSLIWTPTNAVGTSKAVLLDADVYMVGSEDAPGISGGTVQTEVFMTNESASVSYLCAHVGEGWVKLAGVTVVNTNWVNLRIDINYVPATPEVSFRVNGTLMYKAGFSGTTSFPVMAAGAAQKKVTDISFMGTGYLDNFVGKTVVEGAPTFGAGVVNTDGTNDVTTATSIVDASGTVTATFATGTEYITLSGPDGYRRTVRTSGGVAAFSSDLPAGTYSITAYYGDAPSLAEGTTPPAAATIGAHKAAEVAGGNISFTVKPISGLYYTLFAGATPTALFAGAASTLASPKDQDDGFLTLTMPVPANANEVKIIKIYASDVGYAKDAAAPTAP